MKKVNEILGPAQGKMPNSGANRNLKKTFTNSTQVTITFQKNDYCQFHEQSVLSFWLNLG